MCSESIFETSYENSTHPIGGSLPSNEINDILNGQEADQNPADVPQLLECSRNVIRRISQLLADARQECIEIPGEGVTGTAAISPFLDGVFGSPVADLGRLRQAAGSVLAHCSTCIARHDCASPIAASRLVIQITEISHYRTQERRLRAQVTALTNAIAAEAEATRKQREYLAMAAHEFRTPMAIIDATAQRLARPGGGISTAEIAERAGNIRRMVVRLTGLIERTISLAEVDAGKVSFAPRRNDIRRLIEDACHRQRESSPGAPLSLDMQNLPAEMMLDHFLVDHVLSNILSNAIKYSPPDSPIFITCYLVDGFVHIAVKDYGVGIPAGEIPLLFSRFFRASTSAGLQGTGIGLHLCKQFVEMHGGGIDVISHVGFGSTFIIRLPVGMADLSHP